jgi:hypothetical protein
MKVSWPRFSIWLTVLSAIAVFANWPRDLGTLTLHLTVAGFPWTFASWDGASLMEFQLGTLAIDASIAVLVIGAFSFLLSRKSGTTASPRREAHAQRVTAN